MSPSLARFARFSPTRFARCTFARCVFCATLALAPVACAASPQDSSEPRVQAEAAPATRPSPKPPSAPPPLKVERLAGLDYAAVRRALFAPPHWVRYEGDVVLWQYRGGDCVLDAAFWRERDQDSPRVQHLAARNPSGGEAQAQACLDSLRSEGHALRAKPESSDPAN